ncbi:MAG: exosome complex protein Rrp42 [Promethearchaeota archaeon]
MDDVSKVISTIEKDYLLSLLKNGERIDGRGPLEYRPITIESNLVPKAEGSAKVCLGDTMIIAGVKYELGTPFSDTPDLGVCTVMTEFWPGAHPIFESGPPDEMSIECARVIDRGLRHADCIDYKALCVVPEKWVYILFADMYIMNYSGNLWDCGHIATLTALLSSKIPAAKVVGDGEVEFAGNYMNSKSYIKSVPMTMTFVKIGNNIVVDPSIGEEFCADARITFTVDENDMVTSMQKGGVRPFTVDEVLQCTSDAVEVAAKLRKQLDLRQYIVDA